MTKNNVLEKIIETMRDLQNHATDTVWLTEHETVFERLAEIYLCAGGDVKALAEIWPNYF